MHRTWCGFMNHRRTWGMVALLWLSIATALSTSGANSAWADYSPPQGYLYGMGVDGGLVQSQGTPMNPTDAANAWNAWTARSKLAPGSSGCGSGSTSCIIYAYEGNALYWTQCIAPQVSYAAGTYVAAGQGYRNLPSATCPSGSPEHPLFLVSLDADVTYQTDSDTLLHIARHEAGHALELGDALVPCYLENWFWYPLMNNAIAAVCRDGNNQSVWGKNYTATFNEAVAVVIRNDW